MQNKVLLLMALFILSACTQAPTTQDDAVIPEEEAMMEAESDDAMEAKMEIVVDTENNEKEMMVEEESEARTVMVHTANWEFSPSTIVLKKGENVSLHLMGIEGNHGIAIPGLGINENIEEGANIMVNIPTDTPGTYEFFCNVPCGSGHKEMRGTIVIE